MGSPTKRTVTLTSLQQLLTPTPPHEEDGESIAIAGPITASTTVWEVKVYGLQKMERDFFRNCMRHSEKVTEYWMGDGTDPEQVVLVISEKNAGMTYVPTTTETNSVTVSIKNRNGAVEIFENFPMTDVTTYLEIISKLKFQSTGSSTIYGGTVEASSVLLWNFQRNVEKIVS